MASRASCSPGSRATKRCSATGMGDPSSHSPCHSCHSHPAATPNIQDANTTGEWHRASSPTASSGPSLLTSCALRCSRCSFIIYNMKSMKSHDIQSDYMRQVHATPSLNFLMSKLTQNPFTTITPRTPSGRLRKVLKQAIASCDSYRLQRPSTIYSFAGRLSKVYW